jgi:NAD(P)-dependent dehydrogenase (short-subunit alcohol dehydrogenase family)
MEGSNMRRLAGKVAIVTGASAGIGRATAKKFASEGAMVVVGARRQSELETLISEIEADGGVAAMMAGDVTNEDYAKTLVEIAFARFGGLDVAFNNAGTLGEAGPSEVVTKNGFEGALAVNLTASFIAARAQIPRMVASGGGSVIFTCTIVGSSFGIPGTAAYAASKSGLVGLTQTLATEYGPKNVRVNAILPGAIETSMYREMNDTPDKEAFMINMSALKRLGRPEELAGAALFLASEDSSFVTGTAMLVDGGATITRT